MKSLISKFSFSAVLVAGAVSCSQSDFKGGNSPAKKPAQRAEASPCDPTKDQNCQPQPSAAPPEASQPADTLDSGGGNLELLQQEAVFAVRNVACSLCHGNIESNIITDFAATTGQKSTATAFASLMHLSKRGDVRIAGNLLIPKISTAMYASAVTGGISNCAETGPVQNESNFVNTPLVESVKKCFEPKATWTSGSGSHIVEKQSISINPVNDPNKIRAIADQAALAQQGYAPAQGGSISPVTGNKSSGFKLTGAVTCDGAVVFDAPIYIKAVQITSKGSCRIYSTGSIFVFGGLSSSTGNIQLMSSTYVGFDTSLATINYRFGKGGNVWVGNYQFSTGSAASMGSAIVADMNKVGAQGEVGDGAIAYDHFAISAPLVFSKSTGQLTGVMVAEMFLGPIGASKFAFDQSFAGGAVKLFPEISQPLVEIK
jgi:hypothetical protein